MKDNIVAVFTEPRKVELVRDSISTLNSKFALVEYLYCGICGGDYSVYCGYRPNYPISLGHEFVARVISVGKSVTNIQPGQYVVSDFNFRCNECEYCLSNQSHLCLKNDIGLFSNRGFAKYASIHSSYLLPICPPAFLPRACLVEPLSCVIHAYKEAEIQQGMRILICGGGGIGMLFCFLLRKVYGKIDVVIAEKNPRKSMLLHKHFAVEELDVGTVDEYDLIVDCSNSIEGLKFSLDKAKRGGNLCVMSHLYGLDTSFVYEQICKKELHCSFPLRNGEQSNLALAAKFLDEFWIEEYDDMLTIYDDVETAFKEKKNNPFCKQIVRSSALSIAKLG